MPASDIDLALAAGDGEVASRLLNLPEGQWFDRKSGRITARDLASSLVAFANAEGGVIAIGLHDGHLDPPSETRINDLRQAALDHTRPAVRAKCTEREAGDGSRLLIIEVSPGERVHETSRGECFVRVGDEDRKLTFHQRQELEYDRGPQPYDGTGIGQTMEALDASQVEAYREALGSVDGASALRARNLLTGSGEVNVAGYLLFSEWPQATFPSAHVRVLKYLEDERGAGSTQTLAGDGDIRCEGSLPQQIEEAADAIQRLLPSRRALGASGRFESTPMLPREAWLEGLVNAVVHRSYSIAGDHVRVEIFPSRIEITSPGRFPGIVDPTAPLRIGRHARNPRIARVCSDLGITQELGEGIRRIFAEMRLRGFTDPVYTQTPSSVKLTLSAIDALPDAVRQRVGAAALHLLSIMRLAGRPLGTGELVELSGKTRPTVLRYLDRLRAEELIVWEGRSERDPRATWRLT